MKELNLWKSDPTLEKCPSPKLLEEFNENVADSLANNKQISSAEMYPISKYF